MENDKIIQKGVIKLSNYENAKELFLKYRGSHFQMDREGESVIYKQYNISKKQELIWMEEYSNSLFKNIENSGVANKEFSIISSIPTEYKSKEFLNKFITIYEKIKFNLDSFSNLRILEEIFKIIETLNTLNKKQKREIGVNLIPELNSLLLNPITVNDYYFKLGYLNDLLTEEGIIERINELIVEIENL